MHFDLFLNEPVLVYTGNYDSMQCTISIRILCL